MAKPKTAQSDESVQRFLDGLSDEKTRRDCYRVSELMAEATRAEPKMWGSGIVGFGQYRYKYESGREGDWFLAGFSPRKQNLTLYLMSGFAGHDDLMKRLGKYKTGKSCLYIKTLDDIDVAVLKELIELSIRRLGRVD